ncbi:MAG: hypothetical protein ACTHN5_07095 [Phycisphaerae bacterium]
MDPWLALELRRHPVPCPNCRRALEVRDGRCARCKNELTLGLASTDFYQLSWGILAATLAGALGIGALFDLVVINFRELPRARSAADAVILAYVIIGPGAAAALFAAFRWRQRFFRLDVSRRWALTAAAVALLAAMIAAYAFIIE